MRKSIATVCLSGTLDDKLSAAAAAGFTEIELFENDLIATPWTPEQVGERCRDLGLSIDLYQPFRDFEAVAPATLERNLRRASSKFALMRRLNVDTILVCSSVSPEAADDDALAASQLSTLAERAADHGLRIAYEALAWGRHVNTWEHSWEIVQRADHPALGMCLDSFHILSRAPGPGGIADLPGEKIFFVQLADAPRLNMDVLQWSRHHRLFPGQGAFDLPAFLRSVVRAGYSGPLSLEVFNDVMRQSPPDRAAVDAMRSLIALEEDLGADWAPALPYAPGLTGYAFGELVTDASSEARMERALAAMGFAHIGQHLSKPVQLWQQGAARVLLNFGVENRTGVSALAVETTDPARSVERARALLAPVLPRTRGPAEADLTAVEAPDGTAVFFVLTSAGDATSWLNDFILTDTEHTSDVGLTHIDHIALAQPSDHFDEAALFYRSVFGLEPHDDGEFAAPFGLVRSRAVVDPGGRVRIVLHGPLLRRGKWAPGIPDPQHVAFATDDIFGSAARMRERGAPLLHVSDNYYDDLDARLELDPDLLGAMREFGVLYDRDQRGGEFLHLYTEVLGGGVFFEVVQRIAGYAGYGSINAPVRMAAHCRRRRAAEFRSSPTVN